MKSLRVVMGSDDGEVIVLDHMGEAKDFYIFDFSIVSLLRVVERQGMI